MSPAAMIAATASPARRDVVEARHDAARRLGARQQLDRHLEDHRQHALAADDRGEQVEARSVERVAAELDRLAGGGEAAHLEHVVQRQAVLQAVHAARVLGDVAADGAGDLAARVGRVEQAVRRRGFADREVADAALHGRGPRQRVDGDDAVELGQAERHAERVRQRAARKPGAGAARDHRHLEARGRS